MTLWISNNAQEQAKKAYLQDKRNHVSHGTITSKSASFQGWIDTKTGNIIASETLWRYWGKQASRSIYYDDLLISEIVYTW